MIFTCGYMSGYMVYSCIPLMSRPKKRLWNHPRSSQPRGNFLRHPLDPNSGIVNYKPNTQAWFILPYFFRFTGLPNYLKL